MAPASIRKPIGALALDAAIIAGVIAALGASPAAVFAALYDGAFGNWYALTDTIVKATPLIFTGLAISVAFSGALWNIGADGQLTIGAIAAGAGTTSRRGRSRAMRAAAHRPRQKTISEELEAMTAAQDARDAPPGESPASARARLHLTPIGGIMLHARKTSGG